MPGTRGYTTTGTRAAAWTSRCGGPAPAGGRGTFRLGAQVYRRTYPNYVSLLDLATGLDTERDEKDYVGILPRVGYSWVRETGISWEAEYSLFSKRLGDKRVVDRNGVLTEEKQRDFLHVLKAGACYRFRGGLTLGLDAAGGLNSSNQNFYDGLGTLTLADDVFTPDFYDYTSWRIAPRISYAFSAFPLTAGISCAFETVSYDERKAKFADGTYKDEDQWERRREVSMDLRYELTDTWSVVGRWQRTRASSNNDDERTYRYDYTTDSISLGIAFSY